MFLLSLVQYFCQINISWTWFLRQQPHFFVQEISASSFEQWQLFDASSSYRLGHPKSFKSCSPAFQVDLWSTTLWFSTHLKLTCQMCWRLSFMNNSCSLFGLLVSEANVVCSNELEGTNAWANWLLALLGLTSASTHQWSSTQTMASLFFHKIGCGLQGMELTDWHRCCFEQHV